MSTAWPDGTQYAMTTHCPEAGQVPVTSTVPGDGRLVRQIRRRLLRWGRANFANYCWRTEPDPWLTLVAEFLLQRTRASQVEIAFQRFREQYPTAEALVTAGAAAARRVTDMVGLHWRAPLLYQLAIAVNARGGEPPEDAAELRKLIGIGMYTTAAWLSLHRNRRAVLVDSNVARWLSRLIGRPYPRDPRHVRWIQELADQLTPQRAHRAYNYAVLDFTMTICTLRQPKCDICVLQSLCAYGRPIVEDRQDSPANGASARAATVGHARRP